MISKSQVSIPIAVPHLTGNVRRYIDECIETNYVSSVGPFVTRFEQEFAQYVGSRYAVACVSGTAALHIACRLLGIGAGDEVFVPTFTFVASVNTVIYEGGAPVLMDSERKSWNLDPSMLAGEIRHRANHGEQLPRAVEVVHILGHPAEIAPILEVCAEFGIVVFEDAAESLGATYVSGPYSGKHVGTIGKVGCFSFNGNKIITAGGGGMLTTDDEALARRAKHLTTQARLPGVEYRHDEVGFNYRLTNIAAAIGLSQLELLPEFLYKKRAIAAAYDRALAGLAGIKLPPRTEWANPSMWLYSILVDPTEFGRDWRGLMAVLAENCIDARPLWSPVHRLGPYRQYRYIGGTVAEDLFAQGLTLPCSVGLTPEEQDRVIECVLGARR